MVIINNSNYDYDFIDFYYNNYYQKIFILIIINIFLSLFLIIGNIMIN